MKTIERKNNLRIYLASIILVPLLLLTEKNVSAHCDTMDGPVIKDARTAIEKNNVNYVLKWVHPEGENEVRESFKLAMKVRELSTDARLLADRYFFETLIRVHRIGEGVSYTGLKPSGTPVDKRILNADAAIEKGNLESLKGLVPEDRMPELSQRFKHVMHLKNFDPVDVKAGREYVEAYVSFFKFAEGEEDSHAQHVH